MEYPEHLNEKAYDKYKALHKIVKNNLEPGDEYLLAVLANTYINYDESNQILMTRPMTQGGENRTYKNPAHDMVKENIKTIIEVSSLFGLSPKSRGGKLGNEKIDTDDFDDI